MRSINVKGVTGSHGCVDHKVRATGKDRGTLYLPPAEYEQADNDSYANKDFSLEGIALDPFVTKMCACRNFGIMVYLVALAAIRRDDGTVVLDVGNSNLELFAALFALLPRFDAATTEWAAGTIDRGLVLRAIDESKQSYEQQRGGAFPTFVALGAKTIQKYLNGAVVPDYGNMKLLDDRRGDGVPTPCLQFAYNGGYGTVLTEEPRAVIYADNYEVEYKGKEELTPSHVIDLIAGSILHGKHIVARIKPYPALCVRSGVVLFAAASAFLPPSFELARPRAFGDSEIVFKCGPGSWDDRIRAYRLYCWVLLAGQAFGLEYVVPNRVRELDAAEHVTTYFGSETHRTVLQAQLAKLLPPGGLGPDARRKVVELIESGCGRSEDIVSLLNIVDADVSLRVLGYYVERQLKELGAAARDLVESGIKTIVGAARYDDSVARSEARMQSDSINIASDALTFAAHSARLETLEAEAAREEAASLPVRLDLALTVVLEEVEGKKAYFSDIRYAVSRQICDAFPAEAAELTSARSPRGGHGAIQMLARKVRAHKGGAGMDMSRPCLLDYRVKPAVESLPAVAGAAPSPAS